MPIYLEDISQYGVGGWIGETAAMRLQERQGQISNNARYTVCPFQSLHFIVCQQKLQTQMYKLNFEVVCETWP